MAISLATPFIPQLVSGLIGIAWGILASIGILHGSSKLPREVRRPWIALGASALLLSLGVLLRGIDGQSSGDLAPLPSYADFVHVPAYLLFLFVTVSIHRRRAVRRNLDAWLDATATTFGVAIVLWIAIVGDFVTAPVSNDQKLLLLVYHVIVLVACTFLLRNSATPGYRPPSYYLLAAAAAFFLIADTTSSVVMMNTAQGMTVGAFQESLAIAFSPLAYSFGLAAITHPSASRVVERHTEAEERPAGFRLLFLSFVMLTPLLVLLVEERSTVFNVVLAGLLIALTISALARTIRLVSRQQGLVTKEATLTREVTYLATLSSASEIRSAVPRAVAAVTGERVSSVPNDGRFKANEGVHLPSSLSDTGGAGRGLDFSRPLDPTDRRIAQALLLNAAALVTSAENTAMANKLDSEQSMNKQIAKSEKRFRALVQHASDAVLLTDADGIVTFASPSIEQMSGHPAEQYLSRTVAWAIHKNDVNLAAAAHQSILDGTPQAEAEVRLTDTSGDTHLLSCVLTNMLEVECVEGIVVNVSDMTDRRQLEATLRDAEIFDPLTLLFNRTAFKNEVDSAIRRSSVTHSHVQVTVINIDDFRVVNEGHGTQIGDQILVETAARIRQQLRIDDVIARLNGDEFGVLSLFDGPPGDKSATTERILSEVAKPMTIDGHTINIRATAGIAIDTDGSSTGVDMLRHADTAIDTAKESLRGSALVFESSMGEAVSKRAEIRGRLSNAVDNDELRLVYQPIVNIETGEIVSLEALSRWTDPELGIIGPDVFIPIAERGGLIGKLGERVLHSACHQIAAWREMGFTGFAVSINLSAQQLHSPTLVTDIEAALRESSVEADRLMIEITESMLIDDTDDAARQIRALRALGLKLAIDDFGTGYSSLSYLQRYDFDVLKVDRSFVTPIGDPKNTRERAIVRAMITLAQDLGATTVAEGIETEDELQALRELDCDNAQGYLLHRPLEAESATDVLRLSSQPARN